MFKLNLIYEDFIEDEIKDNRYNESESIREDDLPIKEGLFNETPRVIKGILLAFVYFFVIIYSLLYMLTPEKSTNLIFIGNYDTSLFNYTFYKVDDIKIKENLIILNIFFTFKFIFTFNYITKIF